MLLLLLLAVAACLNAHKVTQIHNNNSVTHRKNRLCINIIVCGDLFTIHFLIQFAGNYCSFLTNGDKCQAESRCTWVISGHVSG